MTVHLKVLLIERCRGPVFLTSSVRNLVCVSNEITDKRVVPVFIKFGLKVPCAKLTYYLKLLSVRRFLIYRQFQKLKFYHILN